MGDYFCCVKTCRAFTWQSARFVHRRCGTAADLVRDGAGSYSESNAPEPYVLSAGVVCAACSEEITDSAQHGHYRVCPECARVRAYQRPV